MNKKIYKCSDIRDKSIKAIDAITDPIAQTLSPMGGNVIFEDNNGNQFYTQDGVTIAKNIFVKDEVENAIIEIIKGGSLQTNMDVGDGTSSTILMSSVLIKEGFRLIDNGHNQMNIRDELIKFSSDMEKELKKKAIKVKNDNDIKFIAKISANGDSDIADNIVKVMKIVGLDGQVMIDKGYSPTTEIIEDTGFILNNGVFDKELANQQFQIKMENVPVLITDKRLYYKSEAETMLKTVLDAGYSEVVIIAKDFVGDALPYFIANHKNGNIGITLIKESEFDVLEDLAIYLGGDVISDKKGMLVDKISIKDFMISKRVYSDPRKSIVSRDKKEVNKGLTTRIKSLRGELKRIANKSHPEYGRTEKRISSLTNGMVTIKVGGATDLETIEKIFRYEDSVNAARAAMREGYLPGAGIAVYGAFKKVKIEFDYVRMLMLASTINIRQIAENCGLNGDIILDKINNSPEGYGYNAKTNKIEDVIKAGIIEPYLVTTQVIKNAVSIANIILTSRYMIVNDLEDNLKDK